MNGTDPVALAAELIRRPPVTPADAGALPLLWPNCLPRPASRWRCLSSALQARPISSIFSRGSGSVRLVFFLRGIRMSYRRAMRGAGAKARVFRRCEGWLALGQGRSRLKGGVAASVSAVLRHLARHGAPQGSIAFLLTGDEEGPAINGTVKLLEWARERGHHFDHCLLGEPTNPEALGDMIKIGRRGSLTGHLKVIGRQGHAAYPHLSDNPIPPREADPRPEGPAAR